MLWHGWLKKLGRFSRRWRKRYFVFLSTPNGMKELRHYDTFKDVHTLLLSTPQGVISLTDATGICCFTPVANVAKKPMKFVGQKQVAVGFDQESHVLFVFPLGRIALTQMTRDLAHTTRNLPS